MSTDPSVVMPCAACRAWNRVPRARFDDRPICADCGARLLGAKPTPLTVADFDGFVTRCDLPVIVDFWAPWCGPCKYMAPEFEKAAALLAGRAVLAKVDTEAEPQLAARFSVSSIPTLAAFDHGTELLRRSGASDAAHIETWVSDAIRGIA